MEDNKSRTDKFTRNATVSVVYQVLVISLGFATRTAFIAQLGVEMLGINTLLTSIVALLAFADLGINGAVMYALYNPLKMADRDTVSALVKYAGKLFWWVALVVAVVGIALVPFIDDIVGLETEIAYLEVYYLLFLGNTVASYLMLSRLVLLDADQKVYITKSFSIFFEIVRALLQICVLIFFESFLLFLIVQLIATLSKNWAIYVKAGQHYPYLREGHRELNEASRKSMLQSVRAMMVFRIAGLVMGNSSPLLISVFAGTLALGFYSNYMLIVAAAAAITEVIFQALTPSVGNLVTGNDRDSSNNAFSELTMASVLLHGTISVLILVFVDDFITVWLGFEFLLSIEVVAAIVFNFYVAGTMMPIWSFRNATGLFRSTQWLMVATAMLSIILSLVFGTYFGMVGVIVSPAIARLVTGGWFEPWLLIRKHLNGNMRSYYLIQISAFFLWSVLAFGTILLTEEVLQASFLLSILIKLALVAVLLPVSTWMFFGRTSAYRSLLNRVRGFITRYPKLRGI